MGLYRAESGGSGVGGLGVRRRVGRVGLYDCDCDCDLVEVVVGPGALPFFLGFALEGADEGAGEGARPASDVCTGMGVSTSRAGCWICSGNGVCEASRR